MAMEFDRSAFSDTELVKIYRELLIPRLIEERMLILLRQGKLSKWFSGFGQEATSVGLVLGMNDDEYLFPMHRNLGMFTARGIPLHRLFSQFQGKNDGFTKGRDRSFHFGSHEHKLVGMISHLGPQMGLACGVALADKLAENHHCTLVVTGDGGASEGDFHESLNVASVWDLPVLFVVENNGWGLSTPSNEQFRCKSFVDKGIGYGMEAIQMDGNNILDVISTIRKAAQKARADQRPILIESITFRMRGHEEASGTKYYPEGLQAQWAEKDPIDNYERYLRDIQLMTEDEQERVRQELQQQIKEAILRADQEEFRPRGLQEELLDVYALAPVRLKPEVENTQAQKMRFLDAINQALALAMERDDKLILMGQDIADYGGVFKVTEGLMDRFGKQRVRNTPLCESAILGTAVGLTLRGFKAMIEMQFADFVSEGMTQIVNNMAKMHYRWGHPVNCVIRMPTGAGTGAGPFHSQSNEAWFFHVPGLKIVYPSNPHDAKGLLLAAFEDPNPVLYFEHKVLYRTLEEEVPNGYYTCPIGVAHVVKTGDQAVIITYGMGVHWALAWCHENPDYRIEVIDLRSLAPMDWENMVLSVKKCGRVLVLHEDNLTGGIGAEIAAKLQEWCFEYLDAPIMRCASEDTPIPFNPLLEENFLANRRLHEAMMKLLSY
ncbi:MAG TPA: dehydrogenase E1 component subunit alpha/beta [Luteibaculaceae bacterium]|nr:dehydrogenase E1 component subunit alpha/beta [Luteibaculaceae bacterium]